MPPQQRELVAEFIRERNVFINGDGDDATRVIIGEVISPQDTHGIDHNGEKCFSDFLDADSTLVIKGEADEKQLRPGLTYRFYGHDFIHSKYGKQFVFSAFTVEQPATENAVVEYLQQCRGIGPGIARRLWDNYGANAIAALRTNPVKCADEIKGLKSDVAQEAADFLKQFEGIEKTKTEVLGLLAHRGFPKKTTDYVIKKWGSDAAAIIRRCPYYLMTFRGCGFLKTDKMYLELGLPPDRLKRQALCAWHAIARDSEGHTWFPLSLAQGAISRSVSGGLIRSEDATELAIRAQMLDLREHSGCQWISEKRKADAEGRVAEAIVRASKEKPQWPDINTLAQQGLGEEQFVELQKGLAGVVGLLTGAPGTGKTFTAAAVIREIMRMTGGSGVAAAAPTGKAAVRLTELLSAAGISLVATTIHRLLQVESQEGGGWEFHYNSGCPLPHRYVFIDECFPAGTLIDTPSGQILIEDIAPGNSILNAIGQDTVVAKLRKEVKRAAIITAGETQIVCSENHPIFTSRGVVFAGEIKPGDFILRTSEAVRLLQNGNRTGNNVERISSVLFDSLLNEMVDAVPGIQSKDIYERASGESWCRPQEVPCIGNSRSDSASGSNSESESDGYAPWSEREIVSITSENRTQATDSRRQRQGHDSPTGGALGNPGAELKTRVGDRLGREIPRLPHQLQSGLREYRNETGNRVRWPQTQKPERETDRCEERGEVGFARVDSVEILESTDSRMDRYRDADGLVYFYDLQAARHRSYSVEGLLVHNCSMLDTDLMASLLSARGPGTHFLFLGDPHQLAPVGHGCPLKDMIAADVPCGELREIRRNSGRIVRACAAIRDDRRFVPSPAVNLENGENLQHVETSRPEDTIERMTQFIESVRAGGKFDPVWDVQILVAVNKKSKLGRRPLNQMLQQLLNPDGERAGKNPFRQGDKIINLKNGRFKSHDQKHQECDADGNVNVANGEIGEVILVEPIRTICRLQFPDRVVMIFHGGMGAKNSDQTTDDDDKKGPKRSDEDDDDDTGTGCTWDLAYAISTHKSQGSEFPIAVILIDDYAGAQRLCTRNWLFTGISRAKKLCVTIGPQRLAQQMCQKDGLRRMTFLVERVKELMPRPSESEPMAISDDVFKSLFAVVGTLAGVA